MKRFLVALCFSVLVVSCAPSAMNDALPLKAGDTWALTTETLPPLGTSVRNQSINIAGNFRQSEFDTNNFRADLTGGFGGEVLFSQKERKITIFVRLDRQLIPNQIICDFKVDKESSSRLVGEGYSGQVNTIASSLLSLTPGQCILERK
jgi:hypothetical protein